ncbi:MAG TPA: ABC transporter ATP-binding protein [Candidatus Krumholzibacteria bacterium]|nr:ABC transporter ATP-binding protein [Candidatus Krumholzibacteria bacterium]
MIEATGLGKRFGARHAVRDVTFSIAAGEIVGFLGPNGAGKTTTLRMLTGFLPPTEGEARVAGFDVVTQSMEVRSRIGYLPETVPVYRDLTVSAYLEYVGRLKGIARHEQAQRIATVVEACGIGDVRARRIGALSRGYRQRVGLAQALLNDPDVLFLDEPTVGLDPKQIVEIRELIRSLAGRRTVLLSTHILPEVNLLCRRVLIIHKGRLVADARPEELRARGKGSLRIEVEARAPGEVLAALLARVAGIAAVEALEASAHGDARVRVTAKDGDDPREAMVAALVAAGIGLRSMSVAAASLEDVFLELVTREE